MCSGEPNQPTNKQADNRSNNKETNNKQHRSEEGEKQGSKKSERYIHHQKQKSRMQKKSSKIQS